MLPRLPAAAVLAALVLPDALAAQSAWLGPSPPPVIRIVRETARFGTSAAHVANERHWVEALEKKKVPYSYVGTIAATGAAEFWFIGGAENFAGFEALDQIYQSDRSLAARLDTLMAREASFVTGVQTILASYRPDLSYRPMFIQPETRHFWISTFTVRPGQEAAFDTMLKAYVEAYSAADLATPWVTYQLAAGGPSPTFYLVVPLNSFGDMDRDLAAGKSVGEKLSSPVKVTELFTASTALVETQVLTITPQVSYVPEEFANQDKAFWRAK